MSKPVIIDDNYKDTDDLFSRPRGCVERDWKASPPRMAAVPTKIIPQSEWSARIKERIEQKRTLRLIRDRGNKGKSIPSLNQGSYGYCWGHSGTHGHILVRARDGQPYIPLSAFAVCATIKQGRNQGGWGAQGLEFMMERGVPDQKYWPQGNAHLSNGTKACWENAGLHKVTENWMDVALPVWDRKMTFEMVMTLLLMNNPVVIDLNWWGHSVLAVDPVEVEPGSFGIDFWNSWGDEWGERGFGTLRGNRAIPNAASAIQTVTASAA